MTAVRTIHVEFRTLPHVTRIIGGPGIAVAFRGTTVAELVTQVAREYGPDLERILLDAEGRLDSVFKLFLNDREWLLPDEMDHALVDGDRVTIMVQLGGG